MNAPTNSPARYSGTSLHSVSPMTANPSVIAGIEMRPAELPHRKDSHHDAHAPAERDDDPARVLGLGLGEQDTGYDPIAQQDQERRPDHLSSEDAQEPLLPLRGVTGPSARQPSPAGRNDVKPDFG